MDSGTRADLIARDALAEFEFEAGLAEFERHKISSHRRRRTTHTHSTTIACPDGYTEQAESKDNSNLHGPVVVKTLHCIDCNNEVPYKVRDLAGWPICLTR